MNIKQNMQNTLAFVVTTPPNSNLTTTAINLVHAALKQGISVIGVFFYQDGVLNAAKHLSMPNDEYQALSQWQQLHNKSSVPLYMCITAAEKRGLSDELAINNNTLAGSTPTVSNIDDAFIVSGLGELVELTSKADRVVQL